jgi:hypothetical protein
MQLQRHGTQIPWEPRPAPTLGYTFCHILKLSFDFSQKWHDRALRGSLSLSSSSSDE